MSSALFLLRTKEIGLTLDELDVLSVGTIYDLIAEKANDKYEWPQEMTQSDIDKFFQ